MSSGIFRVVPLIRILILIQNVISMKLQKQSHSTTLAMKMQNKQLKICLLSTLCTWWVNHSWSNNYLTKMTYSSRKIKNRCHAVIFHYYWKTCHGVSACRECWTLKTKEKNTEKTPNNKANNNNHLGCSPSSLQHPANTWQFGHKWEFHENLRKLYTEGWVSGRCLTI